MPGAPRQNKPRKENVGEGRDGLVGGVGRHALAQQQSKLRLEGKVSRTTHVVDDLQAVDSYFAPPDLFAVASRKDDVGPGARCEKEEGGEDKAAPLTWASE
jgi:hypothetical protein